MCSRGTGKYTKMLDSRMFPSQDSKTVTPEGYTVETVLGSTSTLIIIFKLDNKLAAIYSSDDGVVVNIYGEEEYSAGSITPSQSVVATYVRVCLRNLS